MKRSKSLKLALMGATLFSMTACDNPDEVAAIFEDVDECAKYEGQDLDQCRQGWEKAAEEHIRTAPKYTSIEDCQEDFGPEQCEQAPQQTSSGGSVFMPLMMGYMMGSMLSNGTRSNVATQPLYRSKDDPKSFRTGDNQKVSSKTGVQKVPSNVTKAPSTKTSTVRRGGFGSTAARTSTRSFGG
ncbi:DUF1190 domain-containing protein [Terasakiella sp. A23]|uniref:DUF1190 domain-containing protein n=1 Tax=Terasakiella sp. FCG-A23 TaxID=3080561 RepID=UPI002953AAAF|nr:DUF1190 domain-containing protein [Terasakiella sp. A23]MDV7338145.1 DUF1190 domain-containing protein [Terasakiella sp. A23]